MFIRKLSPDTQATTAAQAAEVLRHGGVVLFPTDTLYCLGADALSDAAVDQVYAIKGRDDKKPMHALVGSEAMAAEYADLSEHAHAALARAPKGKLSIVAKKRGGIENGIARGIDTFGFRIPDHAFCQSLLHAFGKPITATSANAAGKEPTSQTLGAILAQLGPAVSLIDLAIDGGELPPSKPSTVVDMSGGGMKVLREGAVPVSDI